jgi:hypothetical protein
VLSPDLYELVGSGKPASTPPWDEMWERWRTITACADQYLDSITPEIPGTFLAARDQLGGDQDVGTLLLRNIYHYWFHTGEAHAIRQMLGHKDLPQFVGDMREVAHSPAA